IEESRVIDGVEFPREDLLRLEKEMLGQYVTDHPLLAVRGALAASTSMEIAELSESTVSEGDMVVLGGIVNAVGRKFTKRGEPYAVFRLEDLTGGIGVVVFPSLFEHVGPLVTPARIRQMNGGVD